MANAAPQARAAVDLFRLNMRETLRFALRGLRAENPSLTAITSSAVGRGVSLRAIGWWCRRLQTAAFARLPGQQLRLSRAVPSAAKAWAQRRIPFHWKCIQSARLPAPA